MSKTIDEPMKDYNGYDFCGASHCSSFNKVKDFKQQLLQDLTEMSETTHVFPKGFKPGDEPVEKKSVPLSRLKQYLNIEGDDEKAKE